MIKLIVTDVDNTLLDWVGFKSHAFPAMLEEVERITKIPYQKLLEESKIILTEKNMIEYPFVVQELPSVIEFCNHNIDKMIKEVANPSRAAFKDAAAPFLVPYRGVIYTLDTIKKNYPEIPLVILTDAPTYVAMWRLTKTGILHYFNGVFGLQDPLLPIDKYNQRVKVESELLIKHLRKGSFAFPGIVRALPDAYEKPNPKGLKTVLLEYDIEDPNEVLYIGDNLNKDIVIGKAVGVQTAWAKYGTILDPKDLEELHKFSPDKNIQKHHLTKGIVEPDYVFDNFKEILKLLKGS